MSLSPGHGALGHYRTVDAYGAAAATDRVALILRLMDGALDRIAAARGQMLRGEVAAKCDSLTRAIRLVDGLRACLDTHQGGEIAANLGALYDYMTRRLTEGNLRNEARALDEVAGLLGELRTAWAEVAARPATPETAPVPA